MGKFKCFFKIEKIALDFKRLELTLVEIKNIQISLDIGRANWRKIQKLNDDQKSWRQFERHNNLMITFTYFISKSTKNCFLPNQRFIILTYLSNVDVERNDGYKIFH